MSHIFQRILAIFFLLFSLPLLLIFYVAIKLEDGDTFLFKQKRIGEKGKVFELLKIRTMVVGADKLREKYKDLNEAEGPVFKIYNDPRYTKVGKFLAHTGLDEIPQFINVIRGEMALVGPRPLPVDEAKKVPEKYKKRASILPGITSLWIIKGAHDLSFREWMELDLEYIRKKSTLFDLEIGLFTCILIFSQVVKRLKKYATQESRS